MEVRKFISSFEMLAKVRVGDILQIEVTEEESRRRLAEGYSPEFSLRASVYTRVITGELRAMDFAGRLKPTVKFEAVRFLNGLGLTEEGEKVIVGISARNFHEVHIWIISENELPEGLEV